MTASLLYAYSGLCEDIPSRDTEPTCESYLFFTPYVVYGESKSLKRLLTDQEAYRAQLYLAAMVGRAGSWRHVTCDRTS